MKKDWEIKKISDACEIVKDKPEKFKGIKNYYSTGAINNSGNYDEPEKITYIGRPSRANIYPKDGDVGFAKMKLTNKVLRIDNSLNGSVFSTGFCFLRPRKFLDNKFLYYFIISDLFQELKDFYAGDGIMGGIKNSALENIKIPLPPLLEQKNIVKILDGAFEKIEKAKKNTEKNIQNSKELFESYLQNVFNNPEKDWEEKKLVDVCELKSGTTISPKLEKQSGDILYVKVGDMNLVGNEIKINTSSRFINSDDLKSKQIIPQGSVIFPKRGGAIFTNKRRKIIKPTIVDLNTMALVPSKLLNPSLLYYWFLRIDLRDLNNGSSIPQINNYSFDNVLIVYPTSLTEQKSIVIKLDTLFAETKKLKTIYEQKLADLEELKKSILKRAFNGDL